MFLRAAIVTVRAKIVRKSENGGGRDGERLDVEAAAGLVSSLARHVKGAHRDWCCLVESACLNTIL
jgi:hypothetical protein